MTLTQCGNVTSDDIMSKSCVLMNLMVLMSTLYLFSIWHRMSLARSDCGHVYL